MPHPAGRRDVHGSIKNLIPKYDISVQKKPKKT